MYRSVVIEQEIPMELYKAVAEVLAYVYKIASARNRQFLPYGIEVAQPVA